MRDKIREASILNSVRDTVNISIGVALNAATGKGVLAFPKYAPTVKNTVIVAGDSIAAQCPTTAASNKRYERKSWLDWVNILLEHRLTITHNAGIGGNTTAQLLARLDTDVLSQVGEIVYLNIGVNHLHNGQGITVAMMKANLTQIVDRILASGKKIAWNTTTPSGYANPTSLANQLELNAWIREHAAKFPGVVTLADMYPAVDDGTGLPWVGFAQPEDNPTDTFRGVHPGLFGASIMGKVWADAMRGQIFGYGAGVSALSGADDLAGAVGSFAGNVSGVGTGWTLQAGAGGTPTATVTARKAFRVLAGKTIEVQEVNRTSTTDGARFFYQNTAVGVDWNPGDNAVLSVAFDFDPLTSAAGSAVAPGVSMEFWNGLGGVNSMQFASADFTTAPVPTGKDWLGGRRTFQTPPQVIPAGTERFQVFVNMPLGGHRVASVTISRVPA